MIDVYTFGPAFGMRDPSPFVLKLQTYMHLAGLEFKETVLSDPRGAPKGKLPYIRDGDTLIPDSTFCIDYLQSKYGDPFDEELSAEQDALGHSFKTMFEERTYWAMVYSRWIMPEHFPHVEKAFFMGVPGVIRGFVTRILIKGMKRDMSGHGLGRHSEAEIFDLALADCQAFEAFLGGKSYMFGDHISKYDATAYAFLKGLSVEIFKTPISQYICNSKTLNAYIERVEKRAFG